VYFSFRNKERAVETAPDKSLSIGSRVMIDKGCKALDIARGVTAVVTGVEPLGQDYSHSVRVTLKFLNGFRSGKSVVLYAQHVNRLSATTINLNNGNPLKKISVVQKDKP
jgi:hypothetical protein